MNLVLGLLLFAMQRLDTLKIPAPTGAVHGLLIWTDAQGNIHKETVNPATYANLNNKGIIPQRPATFTGTQQDWLDAWTSGRAHAQGGRPTLNTQSGDYEAGTIQSLPDGRLLVYTGDTDIEPPLVLDKADYTGTPPNISANKCGMVITNGTIRGNLNKVCNVRRPNAGGARGNAR